MTPQSIAKALRDHFESVTYLSERALSPKRETWFSDESFVALMASGLVRYAKESDNKIDFLDRLYGEEEYRTLAKIVHCTMTDDEASCKPDMSIVAELGVAPRMALIAEVKLVRDDPEDIRTLASGDNAFGVQLHRARCLYPKAIVLGIVFAITTDLFARRQNPLEAESKDQTPNSSSNNLSDAEQSLRELEMEPDLEIIRELREGGCVLPPPSDFGKVGSWRRRNVDVLTRPDDRHRALTQEIEKQLRLTDRGWDWIGDGIETVLGERADEHGVHSQTTPYARRRASLGIGVVNVPGTEDAPIA